MSVEKSFTCTSHLHPRQFFTVEWQVQISGEPGVKESEVVLLLFFFFFKQGCRTSCCLDKQKT